MNRNIALLWLANTTSLFGTSIYTLALTLLSLEYTQSALGAGAVLFASVIPYLFIGMIGGAVSDRLNRQKLMVFCDLARGVITLWIPIAHQLGVLNVAQIVIVSFLITSFRAFFHPANQASVPLLVNDKNELNKVNAYMGSTENLSLMLGPSLGGVLLLFHFDVANLLYIDSLSYMLSALFIYFIQYPAFAHTKLTWNNMWKKDNILYDAWLGLTFICKGNRTIFIMMIAFALQLLVGVGVLQLGIPKLLQFIGAGGEQNLGFVMSAVACSAMVSSLALAQLTIKQHVKWVFMGYVIRCVAYIMLAYANQMTMIVIAACILGLGSTISGTNMTTVLQVQSPTNMLGKVMAVRSSIGNVADAFAYLVIGGLLSVFSFATSLFIVAVYSFITAIGLYLVWFKTNHIQQQTVNTTVNLP
ncbi:MFS transporter [Paenibacillus campi]|uniref:MFS transporter n=1 Tax=Paenibacillus campi TaxID=3106031 RepID=UPI002AFF4353|nr:MFS transporter [Paenibacillus sp. SGZ-1009]